VFTKDIVILLLVATEQGMLHFTLQQRDQIRSNPVSSLQGLSMIMASDLIHLLYIFAVIFTHKISNLQAKGMTFTHPRFRPYLHWLHQSSYKLPSSLVAWKKRHRESTTLGIKECDGVCTSSLLVRNKPYACPLTLIISDGDGCHISPKHYIRI
jgi:hypothetical protein